MTDDAGLYAQLHRGTPGDVTFYLDAVRGAPQVLELGCGYGRILGELACAGHNVTGLDIDPGMLELAELARESLTPSQASLITISEGDMRNFQLDQRFDRVIIPYNGLYCMLSEAAVIDCLRCAGEHLSTQGKLVFDAYAIDDFHAQTDPREFNRDNDDDNDGPIESIRWQDTVYDVYESCSWDKAAQQLQVSYAHVPHGGGDVRNSSIAHRYILTPQLQDLCEQAGLKLVHVYQDFLGTALTPHAEHMACVARRL